MVSEINVDREEGILTVVWRDGARQQIRLSDLRRGCPCAVCEGNRMAEDDDVLHVISPDALQASDGVTEIIPVGRYAIQIRWTDGHDTGIYTYDYLKTFGTVTQS